MKTKRRHSSEDFTTKMLRLILRAIALAMSIAVIVLNVLDQSTPKDTTAMLGLGLLCLSLSTVIKVSTDSHSK